MNVALALNLTIGLGLGLVISSGVNKAQASEFPVITIDAPYVELLSGPANGYPILHVIEQGEQVSVLVKRTSWLKVQDKRGNEGWFHEDALFSFSQNNEKLSLTEQDFDDYNKRTWEGSVMYGDLEGANFYSVGLGYAFSPVISTELVIGKAIGDISDSDVVELMLVAQPFPDLLITPYVGVGGGIINTMPQSVLADAEKRENALMSAAIGAKYYLARNFLLRAEYKYSLVLTDRDDNEGVRVWKLGFSVFF